MFKKPASISLILILFTTLFCGISQAGRQSLTSITLQAESFLENHPFQSPYPASYAISQLDQRLNLKTCEQPLAVKFTHSRKVIGNTSVTISCKSPVKWQIHLPVQIELYDDVAMSKSPILKGQPIDANNIHYRKKKITQLHQGYFQKSDSIERLQAKRNLAPNTILTSANVAPKLLVTSGQKVTILLKIKGLQIKSTGLALQSASLGQLIKVKNTQSNKIIEGIVSSEGQVTVKL